MSNLYITQISKNSKIPEKQTDHAACFDIHADLIEKGVVFYDKFNTPLRTLSENKHDLYPGERALIPTGLKMCCDPGWKIEIAPRSGNAVKKGLSLANCIGIIDADYRDEVMILLINHSEERLILNHGDRIAQLSLEKVNDVTIMVIDELPDTDSNRTGGLGSTDE